VDVTEQGRRLDQENRTGSNPPVSSETEPKAESQLLNRARRGDTKAYGQLVRVHQDRIYGLVFRMVRDPALAEELTQDVFLKAFRSLSSFRGDARFTTWLYRIAVNLCHDQRESLAARNRSKETSLDSDELGQLEPSTPTTRPDEAMEATEVAAGFQAGLNALEPIYREAFLLRHQEGLNYGEIAEVLGISQSNAKVRVHRAREMVLEALRSRGFDV
jgi:RNA polymerase sigma-70 factor (ECF subfamily)